MERVWVVSKEKKNGPLPRVFRPSRRNENLTLESDAIVGTRVVGEFTQEEDGDIANDALFVRVILAWACLPVTIIINVVLPGWVLVA